LQSDATSRVGKAAAKQATIYLPLICGIWLTANFLRLETASSAFAASQPQRKVVECYCCVWAYRIMVVVLELVKSKNILTHHLDASGFGPGLRPCYPNSPSRRSEVLGFSASCSGGIM